MSLNVSNITKVSINNRIYNLSEDVASLEDIKNAACQIDPSLSNADPVVEGDTLSFVRRAGTKGADEYVTKVIFENREISVDPEIVDNPIDIKNALAQKYPEVNNYDYVISAGTMTFVKRAGTKG